jgi:hypothetical protein
MAEWFDELSEDEQKTVKHGWGSREFSSWTASFLLSIGSMALKSRLPQAERDQLNRLLTQRWSARHRPGHKLDSVNPNSQCGHQVPQSLTISKVGP